MELERERERVRDGEVEPRRRWERVKRGREVVTDWTEAVFLPSPCYNQRERERETLACPHWRADVEQVGSRERKQTDESSAAWGGGVRTHPSAQGKDHHSFHVYLSFCVFLSSLLSSSPSFSFFHSCFSAEKMLFSCCSCFCCVCVCVIEKVSAIGTVSVFYVCVWERERDNMSIVQ